MHTIQHLQEMLAEHKEWQGKINFYKEEIIKLNAELEEFVLREKSKELLAQVEHFQNQFIMQREHLDIMRHDFKQYENAIEHMQEHAIDKTAEGLHVLQENNSDRLLQFEKLFHELRHEFYAFLNKSLVV